MTKNKQASTPSGALVLGLSLLLSACGGSGSAGTASTVQQVPAAALADNPNLLDAIPPLSNQPDSQQTNYTLGVQAAASGTVAGSVSVANPAVASAVLAGNPLAVVITPNALGSTPVTVTVSDGQTTASQTFTYTVQEISKSLVVASDSPTTQAIRLTNTSDQMVDMALTHNGFPTFRSKQEIVDYVRSMADLSPGEPFERKLWRFLVGNVTHWLPTSATTWLDDPLVLINSLGWGLCSHVSGAFVSIALQAGLQARTWGLTGHVVPEVFTNGNWHMYDPDLAVYYFGRDGEIAGVEDLEADPELISSPVNPIFPTRVGTLMYSTTVADLYGSVSNNWIADDTLVYQGASLSGTVELPPQSSLTYPGIWTEPPTGYDGTTPYPVTYFRQARLDLPPGWSGAVNLPWMLWDVQGDGIVTMGGNTFMAGSQAVKDFVRNAGAPINQVQVSTATGMSLIFFINATQYAMEQVNSIDISSKDVWAISAQAVDLAPINRPAGVPQPGQIKPRVP